MIFIAYPKCSTCRKAKACLDRSGISYEQRDIKENNPSYDEVKAWFDASGLPIKKFFNTSGLSYKALNMKEKLPEMSIEECIQILSTDGMLIKRPILVGKDFVLVGFKQEAWEAVLASGERV